MLPTVDRVDRLEVLFEQFMTQVTQVTRAMVRMERVVEEMKEQAEKDRQQAEKDRRQLARQLADISNRVGTVVEDIIAPSLRRLAVEELDCGQEVFFVVRMSKTRLDDLGRRREFDALFVGEKAVLLNETKTTARPEYAREFVEFLDSDQFFKYFPEYEHKRVTPVFSSLYIPEDLVVYLTRHGIYAVGMGEEVMSVLNLEQVQEARDKA